jgi:hypothetical protein
MSGKKASKASKQELNAVASKAAAAVEAQHTTKTAKQARKRANKKVGKKALKGPVSNYLAAYNPYLLSVLDPFRFRGARIPDPITSSSSVATIFKRWTVEPSATHGNLMLMFGCNMANSAAVPAWGAGYYRAGLLPLPTNPLIVPFDYTIGQAISSADPLGFGAGSSTDVVMGFNAGIAWGGGTGIPTVWSSARLVSAAIAVQYVGPNIAAAGTYTTVGCSTDVLISRAFNAGMTYTDVKTLPTATTTALNTMDGVAVRYLPTTAARNDYVRVSTPQNSVDPADARHQEPLPIRVDCDDKWPQHYGKQPVRGHFYWQLRRPSKPKFAVFCRRATEL